MTFVFLISPNNSGTTVISQYLAETFDFFLPPFGNFEGQFVPTVKKAMRAGAWQKHIPIDWTMVKKEWEKLLKNSGKDVFLEASPPNLERVDEISKAFGKVEYLFSISNPYSYIGSAVNSYADKAEFLKGDKLQKVTANWLRKARTQRSNIETTGMQDRLITYERFCENPSYVAELLPFQKIRHVTQVRGKSNTSVREIVNRNPVNIAFLTEEEIDSITDVLARDTDVLKYFGYELLDTDQFFSTVSDAEREEGQLRRKKFLD